MMRNINNRNRTNMWVILFLLAIIAILAILLVGANGKESSSNNLFVSRLRNELNSALSKTNQISLQGGSSTSNTLGQVRQHLYAAKVINQLSVSARNGYILPDKAFDDLISLVEQIDASVQAGHKYLDQQNRLREAIQQCIDLLSESLGGMP